MMTIGLLQNQPRMSGLQFNRPKLTYLPIQLWSMMNGLKRPSGQHPPLLRLHKINQARRSLIFRMFGRHKNQQGNRILMIYGVTHCKNNLITKQYKRLFKLESLKMTLLAGGRLNPRAIKKITRRVIQMMDLAILEILNSHLKQQWQKLKRRSSSLRFLHHSRLNKLLHRLWKMYRTLMI